jgi:phosphatidylinositol glycan class N
MAFIGATHTWPSDSGLGFKNIRFSAFFQVSEESLCLLFSLNFQKVGLLAATMVITASSVVNLHAKNGLPPYNQLTAWSILGM